MISRVRIEASAKTEEELQDDLVGAGAHIRETYGGTWEPEFGPKQTTSDGYWQFLVMVREP